MSNEIVVVYFSGYGHTQKIAEAVAIKGGPPTYVEKNWDRLVAQAQGLVEVAWEHRTWTVHGNEGRTSGIAFYGDDGTLVLDRGGWKVYDRKESLTADATDLLGPHIANFLECVRTRATPNAPIEVGRRASVLAHLGNLAYRRGTSIDPQSIADA